MTIDSESAKARKQLKAQTYYFCSSGCATEFEANPERYALQASEANRAESEELEKHAPPYTTLGFRTSPNFSAAASGGLEYERLPEAHDR